MYGDWEIDFMEVALMLVSATAPVWFGGLLTICTHLVLSRHRQIKNRMLAVGWLMTGVAFAVYWGILSMSPFPSQPLPAINGVSHKVITGDILFVVLLAETVVIVGIAVWHYWKSPAIGLRTPLGD